MTASAVPALISPWPADAGYFRSGTVLATLARAYESVNP